MAGETRSPASKSSRAAEPAASVIAYCLMPNHYHLLVQILTNEFSNAMQSFGQAYVNAINKQQKRTGPLFQSRFQAKHVDEDEYLLHLSRYIHLNPTAADLLTQPEDWGFSSYREFVGLRNGTLPDPSFVISLIGSREKYRDFVIGGLTKRDLAIERFLFRE